MVRTVYSFGCSGDQYPTAPNPPIVRRAVLVPAAPIRSVVLAVRRTREPSSSSPVTVAVRPAGTVPAWTVAWILTSRFGLSTFSGRAKTSAR